MSLRLSLIGILALALCACKPAMEAADAVDMSIADPATTVRESIARFLQAQSFHARMRMEGAQTIDSELDFVAPDRYRLSMSAGQQIVIGNTLYMEQDGRRQAVPLPDDAQTRHWRMPLADAQDWAADDVHDLGAVVLDGQTVQQYRIRNSDDASALLWIDQGGLLQQIRINGHSGHGPYVLTVRYSRFDDPGIRIDTPE